MENAPCYVIRTKDSFYKEILSYVLELCQLLGEETPSNIFEVRFQFENGDIHLFMR